MNKKIEEVVNEIGQRFGNTRMQHCQLSIEEVGDDHYRVSGSVLDGETKAAVVSELSARVPAAQFDTQEVRVLRQNPAKLMAVGTNLAGFHHGPSRITEMVSENVNGTVLEYLYEEQGWVFARQMDGYLGWTYRPYLTEEIPSETPTHMVHAPVTKLMPSPASDGPILSRVFAGTAVRVVDQAADWSKIELAGEMSGWIPSSALCPLDALPTSGAERRVQMIVDSQAYTGVPYRWGGCTVHGIDCSGLVQLLHKMAGVTLPRDADMQFDAEAPVEPPFRPGDLLYFGSSQNGGRKITHVAMSLGGWRIIHSSGRRNGVYEDDVEAAPWLKEIFVGANRFVKD